MRSLLISMVLGLTATLGACTCGDQIRTGADATFYWNSRLVPTNGAVQRTVSGTGATEREMAPGMRMQ